MPATMSLFDDLPSPSKQRPKPEDVGDGPAAKRLKTVGQTAAGAAALVGHPKKFLKASPLLRELLVGGKLQQQHGRLLFEALRLSMGDPEAADRAEVRREYSKLFTTASRCKDLYTTREKNHLDVLGIWAVLRSTLHTDDSFAFNKAVAAVKKQIAALPDASEEEDDVLDKVWAAQQDAASSDVLREEMGQQITRRDVDKDKDEAGVAPSAVEDDDPFGLNALFADNELDKAGGDGVGKDGKRRSASSAWGSAECAAARRQAVLDCVVSAKAQYQFAWARITYELLVEGLATQQQEKFTPKQQQSLSELHEWVKKQRADRKTGPSAAEQRRDMTSFEAARAEWSKASVSATGKVGSKSDHRTEMWLG